MEYLSPPELEGLTEEELLDIDRTSTIPNASMTTYERGAEGLELVSFADTTVVGERQAEVTEEPSSSEKADVDA